MSLLTACNDAQRLLSLAVSATLIADGQETQNLLFALAKEEVAECASWKEWPILTRSQSFTASLASLQSAPGKPTNFDRAIAGTFWNTTTDRQIGGPLNAQEWALAFGEPVTSLIEQYVMFRYDGLYIFPTPTAADTITFEYVINTPWETSGGTALTAPTVDTDVSKFGDRLLKLGLVWRYKQSKGRDYAEDMRNYEIARELVFEGQRGSARTLSIAGFENQDTGASLPNFPVSGFGS